MIVNQEMEWLFDGHLSQTLRTLKNWNSWIGGGWKTQFFFSQPFWFLFSKKKKNIFCFIPIQSSQNYGIPRMGRNFDDYLDAQQKARGIWNYGIWMHLLFLIYTRHLKVSYRQLQLHGTPLLHFEVIVAWQQWSNVLRT